MHLKRNKPPLQKLISAAMVCNNIATYIRYGCSVNELQLHVQVSISDQSRYIHVMYEPVPKGIVEV